MITDLLHKFLNEGGQVCSSVRSGNEVTLPDHWWLDYDEQTRENMRSEVLKTALECKDLPSLTVAEVAEQLNMPYRDVLELIRFQQLGTIKIGGVIRIYPPSIDEYIKRMSEKKKCSWFF